jgi:transposase
MSENKSTLSRPLVLARGHSGRCSYDPVVKQELVLRCLQPGVSIAREALTHSVNDNLLRKWIHHYQAAVGDPKADEPHLTLPAFVPMVSEPAKPKTNDVGLTITLVNGVLLTLQVADLTELSPLLNTLANLPSSASISG